MKKLMITADCSSSGKTTLTRGLLQVLKKRGFDVGALKCGPDYIDPMFHKALGIDCNNIDIFLMGRKKAMQALYDLSDKDIVIMEGAMGYYDGIGGSSDLSAHDMAVLTDTPAIAVICPKKAGNTIAAQIYGLLRYRENSRIAGVILNKCSKRQYEYYKKIIEKETGIAVPGYLEDIGEAELESRHLGLKSPDEIGDLKEKTDLICRQIEENIDVDALIGMMGSEETSCLQAENEEKRVRCRIGIAMDEAFSFYYRNSLKALEREGAELTAFSPMRDKGLPEGIDGLYLGGGYPELHLRELAANEAIRREIRDAVKRGMPTIAECGGFLYLGRAISDEEGREYEMAGLFEGRAKRTDRPVRFGYCSMKALNNSMLFNKGEEIAAHEFHYWESNRIGEDMEISKAGKEGRYNECFVNGSLYAGFPHICLDSELPLAERFVSAGEKYRAERKR